MKSKVIFLLALIMSIITTVLFLGYLNQTDSPGTVQQNTTDVAVAKQTIDQNQLITLEMVEMKTVTTDQLHPSAIANLEEVDGKLATTLMEKGEILLAHRIKDNEQEQNLVSRKITNGYRAVSIGVNVVQSVSNLIQPEDYIDVIVTDTTNENSTTRTLLSNVRVLAVGKKMAQTSEGELVPEYSSITLELRPNDATELINATEQGPVHLTLHSSITPAEE